MKSALAGLVLAVLLTACGGSISSGDSSTPTPNPQPVAGTPTPKSARTYIMPSVGPADTPTPAQLKAFADNFHQAMREEAAMFADIDSINYADAQSANTTINDAYNHTYKAVDLEARGPPTPFDDIGASALLDFGDEQTVALQMLGDYGTGAMVADVAKLQADHQKLLVIQGELAARGY